MIEKTSLKPLDNEIVVFYNVQNLFDLKDDLLTNDNSYTPKGEMFWNQEKFDHKVNLLAEILHVIGDKNPMLIGMVEIENDHVVQEIANSGHLKDSDYKIVHYNSDDIRGIDCALLYDADKIRNLAQEKLQVQLHDDPDFATRDILYFKGETHGDQILHVFVNHWSSRRDGKKETEDKRMAAANVLKVKIESIKAEDSEAKILIMGDFNDEPIDDSVLSLSEIKNEQGENFLRNLMVPIYGDGQGTLVRHREWLLYDQFIVSQGLLQNSTLRIQNSQAFVFRNKEILFTFPDGTSKPNATYGGVNYYGGYSDHLPIYLILSQ